MSRRRRKLLYAVAASILVVAGLWWLVNARRFQLFGEAVSAVATGQCVLALTFDDGPDPRVTDALLAVLAEHGARATFYLVGSEAERVPALTRRIVAAGHELGNHSFTHRRMLLRTPADLRAELDATDALLRAAGWRGPITFRPPYGKKLLVLPWLLEQRGQRTVTWSLEPDSRGEADDAAITDAVLAGAQPGAIVLLHPMYRPHAATRAALPAIIDGLHARGYRLVTVSELLALAGTPADEVQACRPGAGPDQPRRDRSTP